MGEVSFLPQLLKGSRADSTSASYNRGFLRWKRWLLSNGLGGKDALPAKAFHVALYLASIIQTANTLSPLINAFYSVKWAHNLLDLPSPTDSNMVINILEAGKRKLARPVLKKEVVTPDLLHKIYSSLFTSGNIKNQRIICACLLAYSGFFRSEELLKLRRCDIVIHDLYMSVFIESSKTDQYRDGAWVPIARTNSELCPVQNLERFLQWAGFSCDSEDYIFCNLSATKSGYKVRDTCKPISYSTLRDCFREALKPHVPDVNKYCLHSLRSGGASAAANSGIKDRLFKRHGRWLSDSAKDGYVKDSINERLKVSQSLGL